MPNDEAFDAKLILNTIASKEYILIVRRGSTSSRRYGARMRDGMYDRGILSS
jgi:hypothetical protein